MRERKISMLKFKDCPL